MARLQDRMHENLNIIQLAYAELCDELVRLGIRSKQDADDMKAKSDDAANKLRGDIDQAFTEENEETNESNS